MDDHDDFSVSGQLHTVHLKDSPSPRFATLSYTWGNSDAYPTIVACNGDSSTLHSSDRKLTSKDDEVNNGMVFEYLERGSISVLKN